MSCKYYNSALVDLKMVMHKDFMCCCCITDRFIAMIVTTGSDVLRLVKLDWDLKSVTS